MMPYVAETLAKIGFMLAIVLGFLPLLIWAERKASAFIQDRTGPNRAAVLGIRLGGLVHPIADVLKLLFKHDFRPANAHAALYTLAPFVIMTVALTTFAVVPFGDFLLVAGRKIPLVVADLNVGILYVLAIASVGTWGIVMAGWASNNKYSFLGGLRTSSCSSCTCNTRLAMTDGSVSWADTGLEKAMASAKPAITAFGKTRRNMTTSRCIRSPRDDSATSIPHRLRGRWGAPHHN